MSTQAEQASQALNQKRMSWTDLENEAAEIAEAYEQDFDSETTWFEYADGSVAAFVGTDQHIYTYGCRA